MEDTTEEIRELRNQFKSFRVLDYDNSYISLLKGDLRKKYIGITAYILRGSLGTYKYKFIVNKPGERGKLFWGNNAIKRIKKYLDIKKEDRNEK